MAFTGGHGPGSGCNAMIWFGIQTITGRWFMVFCTIMIMSMTGPGYIFSTYSNDLKSSMGYDQSTLNLLSVFKNIGATVGFPASLFMGVAAPWVVLAIGAVFNFFGYFMIWLAVTGKIAKPALWQMCLYICIGANSAAFKHTAALSTCVLNFPESRGVVIGLLTGFLGLSGAIITQIYHAIFGSNSKSLILLIACLPTLVSFSLLRTIRVMKPIINPNNIKVFHHMLYMSLAIATFIVLLIILQLNLNFSHADYVASASVVIFLLCLPLYSVVRQELNIWKEKRNRQEMPIIVDNGIETQTSTLPSLPESISATREVDGCFQNVFKPPARGENYTILQAIFSIDMLLLFVAAACCLGGTVTAIDNLGQIGISLGYPRKNISMFLSLVSIWNYLGRVSSGFLSEYFIGKYKIPRPLMLTFIMLLSCMGHLLIAFGVSNGLYFASVIIGFCFGAMWPLIFSIVSEIFGLKYYSTLLNFGVVASPIGAYIFKVWITGFFYDKEARNQFAALGRRRKAGEELSCNGVKCFKLAFLIITTASVFAVSLSLILVVRTKKFYGSDIYKKFQTKIEIGMADEDEILKVDQEGDVELDGRDKENREINARNR